MKRSKTLFKIYVGTIGFALLAFVSCQKSKDLTTTAKLSSGTISNFSPFANGENTRLVIVKAENKSPYTLTFRLAEPSIGNWRIDSAFDADGQYLSLTSIRVVRNFSTSSIPIELLASGTPVASCNLYMDIWRSFSKDSTRAIYKQVPINLWLGKYLHLTTGFAAIIDSTTKTYYVMSAKIASSKPGTIVLKLTFGNLWRKK